MQQTIVALFDQRAEAERARDELQRSGLAAEEVRVVGAGDGAPAAATTTLAEPRQPRGFFDWLFGTDVPEAEKQRYHSYVYEGGKTLLYVRAAGGDAEFERIVALLERFDPIDIGDEATAGFGREGVAGPAGSVPAAAAPGTETVIPTAHEELQVGKRETTGGRSYRIRSYVVERPVEEQVSLRDERVTIERRAPGSDRPAGEGAFEEKEVEVTERREEPVVGKVVRRGEDVVIRKDATERVETVRDKLRETKVDVDRAAAGNKPADVAPAAEPGPAAAPDRDISEPAKATAPGKAPLD